jgi:hypothetical protein
MAQKPNVLFKSEYFIHPLQVHFISADFCVIFQFFSHFVRITFQYNMRCSVALIDAVAKKKKLRIAALLLHVCPPVRMYQSPAHPAHFR